MRIDIITVLPEMIEGFFNCSIMKRAQNKGLAEIHIHNLRDYTEDKYRRQAPHHGRLPLRRRGGYGNEDRTY